MTRQFTIMAIDIESFGTRTDAVQRSLRVTTDYLVSTAVAGAHLDGRRLHIQDRADGLLLLFEPDQSPVTVAGELIRALDRQLGEIAPGLDGQPLRLQVSLHRGPAIQGSDRWSGEAVDLASRLVGAQPLRTALAGARSAHLALIASDAFYEAVIKPERHSIDPASFAPVLVDVADPRASRCWILVPGAARPPREWGPADGEDAASTTPIWPTSGAPDWEPVGDEAVLGPSNNYGPPPGPEFPSDR